MDFRTSVVAIVVTFVCVVLVIGRAASAPSPPEQRRATPIERHNIAADIRANEIGWREEAASAFPEDAWSQSDDFHARESKQVRGISGGMGIRIEDILQIIDDDLHNNKATATTPDPRGAHAVPCKPRPFYD